MNKFVSLCQSRRKWSCGECPDKVAKEEVGHHWHEGHQRDFVVLCVGCQ